MHVAAHPTILRTGVFAALPFLLASVFLSMFVYSELRATSLLIEQNNLDGDLRTFHAEILELADMTGAGACLPGDVLISDEGQSGPFFKFASPTCPPLGSETQPLGIEKCFGDACFTKWSPAGASTAISVISMGISMGGARCGSDQAISIPGPKGCLSVWRTLEDHRGRLAASGFWPMATIAIALIASLASIFIFVRLVSGRIQAINEAFKSFAAGDRNARAPEHENGDELDELTRGVNFALRKIQQDMASSERISGSLSHQMLAPVRHVRNRVADLLEFIDRSGTEAILPASKQPLTQKLEQVQTEINHVIGMGEGLLTLLSANRKRIAEELSDTIDLDELSSVVAARYRTKARQRNIMIRVDASAVQVTSSQHVVDQILSILVDNAIIYGPANSTITLSAGGSEKTVWIAVHDEGAGAPAATVENVFSDTPGMTAVSSAREGAGGHGIGLLTARQLADNSDIHLGQNRYENGWTVILSWNIP